MHQKRLRVFRLILLAAVLAGGFSAGLASTIEFPARAEITPTTVAGAGNADSSASLSWILAGYTAATLLSLLLPVAIVSVLKSRRPKLRTCVSDCARCSPDCSFPADVATFLTADFRPLDAIGQVAFQADLVVLTAGVEDSFRDAADLSRHDRDDESAGSGDGVASLRELSGRIKILMRAVSRNGAAQSENIAGRSVLRIPPARPDERVPQFSKDKCRKA